MFRRDAKSPTDSGHPYRYKKVIVQDLKPSSPSHQLNFKNQKVTAESLPYDREQNSKPG
jgi:hypothetical protein